MRFEEALVELRNGKKITHPSLGENVYLMGCYVGFKGGEETFEEKKARGMSIVKMKGDCMHPDMGMGSLEHLPKMENICKHGTYPQLNLMLVMADNWEIKN